MTVEDLQDKLHGDGTLRGGYAVVWDGTKGSASGTKYLDADDQIAAVPTKVDGSGLSLRDRVRAAFEDIGPATIREVTNAIDADLYKVNATVSNMRKSGELVLVRHRRIEVPKFGARMVAVYGIAS